MKNYEMKRLQDLLYDYHDYLREEAEKEDCDVEEMVDEAIKTLIYDIEYSLRKGS